MNSQQQQQQQQWLRRVASGPHLHSPISPLFAEAPDYPSAQAHRPLPHPSRQALVYL